MNDKIKYLVRKLIPSQLSEKTINDVIGFRQWVPGLSKLKLRFGQGKVEIEAEGAYEVILFKVLASAEIKGVKITAAEQTVKLLPLSPLRVSTQHQEVQVMLHSGPDLLKEWKVLLPFLPPELKEAVEIDPEAAAVTLRLHKLPLLHEEIKRRTTREVLGRKVSLLDYIEIADVIIKPGLVRILTR